MNPILFNLGFTNYDIIDINVIIIPRLYNIDY